MSAVVDASVLINVLTSREPADGLAERLFRDGAAAVPHLADLEVASTLRRGVQGGRLTDYRAQSAMTDLAAAPLERFPHTQLMGRVWELRGSITAYDAAYVALAEALNIPLLTANAKLAQSSEPRCYIELLR